MLDCRRVLLTTGKCRLSIKKIVPELEVRTIIGNGVWRRLKWNLIEVIRDCDFSWFFIRWQNSLSIRGKTFLTTTWPHQMWIRDNQATISRYNTLCVTTLFVLNLDSSYGYRTSQGRILCPQRRSSESWRRKQGRTRTIWMNCHPGNGSCISVLLVHLISLIISVSKSQFILLDRLEGRGGSMRLSVVGSISHRLQQTAAVPFTRQVGVWDTIISLFPLLFHNEQDML